MNNQIQETTFTAHNHKTIINEAGVILVGYPNGGGAWFEARAAIAHAEYIIAHKEELEQLQQHLEQMWREVALEVMQRFEKGEGRDGISFAEASANTIQSMLEVLSGQNASGNSFVQAPEGQAGDWYRSLWNEDGSDTTTYEQQWTPFLRICRELQTQMSKHVSPSITY